jgi:hypothetical protein
LAPEPEPPWFEAVLVGGSHRASSALNSTATLERARSNAVDDIGFGADSITEGVLCLALFIALLPLTALEGDADDDAGHKEE